MTHPNDPAEALPEAEHSGPPEGTPETTPEKLRLEPTRYGDWELNGKCVDF